MFDNRVPVPVVLCGETSECLILPPNVVENFWSVGGYNCTSTRSSMLVRETLSSQQWRCEHQ